MRGGSCVALTLFLAGCADAGTYPGQCGQLLPGWVTNERGFGILGIASDVRLHRDGQITFNREPVTHEKLTEYIRLTSDLEPGVFVTFAADEGASCKQIQAVREIIHNGLDCNGDHQGRCGEGPGPWPVVSDVPPFPIVQEYKDGKYRWLDDDISDEEWRAKNVRPSR